MTIKKRYTKSSEPSVTSFSFTDIVTNTGFINFFGTNTFSSGSRAFQLTPNVSISNDVFTKVDSQASTGGYVTTTTSNFDLKFEVPNTVRGKGLVNIPFGFKGTATATAYRTFIDCTVQKFDGTTAIDLVQASGSVFIITTSTINEQHNGICAIELNIPLTTFKKGETLRLKVDQLAHGDDTASYMIAHDPSKRPSGSFLNDDNLSFNDSVTQLLFQVPFRLDL